MFSLSIREGSLNILKPDDLFKEYERSFQLSSPLPLSLTEAELKRQILREIKKEKELAIKSKKMRNKSELNENEIHSLELASEKGASS